MDEIARAVIEHLANPREAVAILRVACGYLGPIRVYDVPGEPLVVRVRDDERELETRGTGRLARAVQRMESTFGGLRCASDGRECAFELDTATAVHPFTFVVTEVDRAARATQWDLIGSLGSVCATAEGYFGLRARKRRVQITVGERSTALVWQQGDARVRAVFEAIATSPRFFAYAEAPFLQTGGRLGAFDVSISIEPECYVLLRPSPLDDAGREDLYRDALAMHGAERARAFLEDSFATADEIARAVSAVQG